MIGRLLPVVFIIIAIAIFAGYINPTYTSKILPLQSEIAQYNSTLGAAADFNKKEAELAADRAAIPADAITRLESFLPDGVQTSYRNFNPGGEDRGQNTGSDSDENGGANPNPEAAILWVVYGGAELRRQAESFL